MWNRVRSWMKASRPRATRNVGPGVIGPAGPAGRAGGATTPPSSSATTSRGSTPRSTPSPRRSPGSGRSCSSTPARPTTSRRRCRTRTRSPGCSTIPNPWLTPWELWYLTVVYLELTGNCFWYAAAAGERRTPGELWIIPTPWVRVVPDPTQFVKGYEVAVPGMPTEVFAPDEIIHLKYPNPLDLHYGLSPLQANALTVDANTELQKSRYQTFLAGQRPGMVLQTDQTLTEPTVRRLEEKMQARFGGRENWHRPLVLEQGLKASPWTLTPAEMDYLNSSKMTRDEIFALFRVPPPIAGHGREHGPRRGHLVRGPGDVLRRDGPAEARPDRPGADARPGPAVRAGRGDRVPRLLAAEPGPAPGGRRTGRADRAADFNEIRRSRGLRPYADPRFDEPMLPGG